MSPAFLAIVVALAQQPAGAREPVIADNSFLMEEAYNQEAGVVQHINLYSRQWLTGAWVYAFTQEWPTPRHPRHQLSYTLADVNGGEGAGFGDVGFNWRYQWSPTGRSALAPRVSFSFPTGSADRSRGSGRPGMEINVPLSARFTHVVTHINVGGGHALGTPVDGATSSFVRVGQSIVFLPLRRINLLVEALVIRERLQGDGSRMTTTISPGVRWAHNVGPAQIVPGVAVPLDVTVDTGTTWRVLGYLSVEHPFGGRR